MRKAKNVKCDREYIKCEWYTKHSSTALGIYAGATSDTEDLKGVEVLIAGYPPPHVLWPGWQLDDESDALTRRSPDDPPDFELAEEDADMEDGPDDPPDSPRSCVRVEVSRNYWPMCAHGQDLSAYIASGAGRGE